MSIPRLDRRTFLRASGVAIGLPLLEAMLPSSAYAASVTPKKRMVAVNVGLGLHAPNFVPEKSGVDYKLTKYLEVIKDYRKDFTVITGASHPEVAGGHFSGKSYLTCAAHPRSASFKNTISIDQLVAEKMGSETRFGSLVLSISGRGISWSRSGVEIPTSGSGTKVYEKLFLKGKASEIKQQIQRLKEGQSVLDVVMDKSLQMQMRLGKQDQQKLQQYFTSVREAEQRLVKAKEWQNIAKPIVNVEKPKRVAHKTDIIAKGRQLYDMIHLALQTDSTRVATLAANGMNSIPYGIPGITIDYHNCSHHGKDPERLKQLAIIEIEQMKSLRGFLKKLHETEEAGNTLLNNTMVLFGSNLGNANNHDSRNMPMLIAGGSFKHGQHLAFSQKKNYPLPNLYLSMLQQMGMEIDSFVSSTGTMKGFETI